MKKYLPLTAIVLLFVITYSYCFDSKLDLNGDNASYIQLARNLADGLGYSNVSAGGLTPASHFPPGYPMFLALFVWLGFDSLLLMKILNGVLLLASICLLYSVSNRLSGNKSVALTASLLLCFSPHLMHFASMAMSEMLYLFCAVIAFWALCRYSDGHNVLFYRSKWFYTALLAAVTAYYIRTVGASVLFAVVLFYLFRKEWKAGIATAAGMLLLLLPWSLRNAAYGIESRYFGTIMTVNPWRPEMGTVSSVDEMLQKMITNLDETVVKGFKEILFPFMEVNYNEPSSFVGVLFGVLIAVVILYGCWTLGGRNLRYPFLAFILSNIALFALWHGGNGSRYVVPIAPFLYMFFYFGLFNLLKVILMKLFRVDIALERVQKCAYLLLLLSLPMLSPIKKQAAEASTPFPPAYRNYFALAEMMQAQLPKGVVVSCRKPELFGYFAPSHYALRYLFTKDASTLIADLLKNNVDYVILEQLGYSSTPLYLYPAIQQNPELFQIVASIPNPDTYLLRFNKSKAREFLSGSEAK